MDGKTGLHSSASSVSTPHDSVVPGGEQLSRAPTESTFLNETTPDIKLEGSSYEQKHHVSVSGAKAEFAKLEKTLSGNGVAPNSADLEKQEEEPFDLRAYLSSCESMIIFYPVQLLNTSFNQQMMQTGEPALAISMLG